METIQSLLSPTSAADAEAGEGLLGGSFGIGAGTFGLNALGIGDNECCPTLSFKQRITGLACMVALSLVFNMMAFGVWWSPTKFAFFFCCANACSVGASFFLSGPTTQLRMMFDEERRVATLAYLCALVCTLTSVLILNSTVLTIFFVLIQMVAFVWYTLSYIPYGHQTAKTFINGFVGLMS